MSEEVIVQKQFEGAEVKEEDMYLCSVQMFGSSVSKENKGGEVKRVSE